MLQLANSMSVQRRLLPSTMDHFKRDESLVCCTVLLAEDDDDLRYVMECALKSLGFLVVACPDAQLATIAFRHYAYVDILLTDFEMPGRSGVELARELTSLCPNLPVMVFSGSTLADTTMQEIHDRLWTFVRKPCRLADLGATLKSLLDSRRSAV